MQWRVVGLHCRNDAQLLEAWNVFRPDHLDMLDAVAAVATAVDLLSVRKAIQRAPHRTITAAVDEDLQPQPVGLGGHGLEALGAVERVTQVAGGGGILLKHQRCI